MNTLEQQHADDVSTGKMLSAELDRTIVRVEELLGKAEAAVSAGEDGAAQMYAAECEPLVERAVTLNLQLKSRFPAVLERFKQAIGDDAFNDALRQIAAEAKEPRHDA